MSKKTVLSAIVALFVSSMSAQEAKPVSAKRDVAPFSSILVEGAYKVVFTTGDYAMSLEGKNQEVIDRTITNVRDDKTLVIKPEGTIRTSVVVYVSAPKLENVSINGTCSFQINSLKTDSNLSLAVKGAGSISSNGISCQKLRVSQRGGSSFNDAGKIECQELDLDLSGAGKFVSANLKCTDATLDIEGAGKCEVNSSLTANKAKFTLSGAGKMNINGIDATDVDATINGVGKIILAGKATTVHTQINGVGSINTSNLSKK